MGSNIYDWSTNPDDNSDADDLIVWREGMMPNQVNNSARVMMKRIHDNAYDRLFCREPVVGATNLRVTLEEDFEDYVDGMIVRFRCPNDIGTVPDKALLCVTNIPVDKRGNDGDGLPMVMLSWSLDEKGLRVKRVTGDMFVAGSHITAVYSKIHKIWENDAYEEEQKADKHLRGDTLALLKTDKEWQKYADDLGVFFVYTDSNMAEIQKMIEGNINDSLYGCTTFPVFDPETFTDLNKLGIAKFICKDDDKDCEQNCYKIVHYREEDSRISLFNEKEIYDDGIERKIPLNNTCYSVRELQSKLVYLLPPDAPSGYVDLNKAISDGNVDANRLNISALAKGNISIKNNGEYQILYNANIPINVSSGKGISYIIMTIDGKIFLAADGLISGDAWVIINGFQESIQNYLTNSFHMEKKDTDYELRWYCFPREDEFKNDPPKVLLTCGKIYFREKNYKFYADFRAAVN